MALKDTYRHKGMRKQLVDTVRQKGITDPGVLNALGEVPRHFFLDNAFVESAYTDKAFPIGEGQTISQPFTVAYQTQLLNIKPRCKILEIGTGSGYQACILTVMGCKVFSIERQRKLYEKTKEMLQSLDYKINLHFGDGYKGLPSFAPFDRILITAAIGEVPEQLIKQLKPGGLLVMPLGNNKLQKMIRLTKTKGDEYTREEWDYFKFVPMLPGKAW